MPDIVEASSLAAENAAFSAGAKLVIRTDLLPAASPAPVVVPLEDLTTYTEVDPSANLTQNSNSTTFAAITRATTTYVYKDFGLGRFGEFAIDFELLITAGSNGAQNFNGGFMRLCNALNDMESLRTAGEFSIGLLGGNSGSTRFICLNEAFNKVYYNSAFFTPALNVTYYCTLSRNPPIGTYGSLTLTIYSDALRTVLVRTLSLALHSNAALRYLAPVQTVNTNYASVNMSGKISNIGIR